MASGDPATSRPGLHEVSLTNMRHFLKGALTLLGSNLVPIVNDIIWSPRDDACTISSCVFCFGFTADMHFRAAASSAPTTTRGSPGRGSRPRARSLRGMESWTTGRCQSHCPRAGRPGRRAPTVPAVSLAVPSLQPVSYLPEGCQALRAYELL